MNNASSRYVYVTFIKTTPDKLWTALTSAEFTKQYWFGVSLKSDWQIGSDWSMAYSDGEITDDGKILESDPPKRLVLKWQHQWRPELKAEGEAVCTIELEPFDDVVKLTVTHVVDVPDSKLIVAVSGGWPRILSNLKSLMETGEIILKSKPS